MYLLDAAALNGVLSNAAQAGGGGRTTGLSDISRYANILSAITSRVEECLEVESLTRQTTVDYFKVVGRRATDCRLRLSRGFLSELSTDLVFTNDEELAVTYRFDTDLEKGIIDVSDLLPGRYKVTYVSGFAVDEEYVFQDVPVWLQSIAIYAAQMHYRLTTKAGETPANVSYSSLIDAVRRELYTRITKRYQRDRIGVEFATRSISYRTPDPIPDPTPDPDEPLPGDDE